MPIDALVRDDKGQGLVDDRDAGVAHAREQRVQELPEPMVDGIARLLVCERAAFGVAQLAVDELRSQVLVEVRETDRSSIDECVADER